jgi:hypothetical protein
MGDAVIATALGAETLVGDRFDVVVRCDPGHNRPPLPSGFYETGMFPTKELIVVDADDRGHPVPALWSRSRARAYAAAGWARLGADPDAADWEVFKARVVERRERP